MTIFRQNIERRRKKHQKGGNGHESGNVYDITDVGMTRLLHLLLPQKRHRKDGSLSPAPETPHTTITTEIKTADVTSHISPSGIYLPANNPAKNYHLVQGSIRLSCQNIALRGATEPPITLSPPLSLSLSRGLLVGLGCLAQDGLPERMPLPPSRRRTFENGVKPPWRGC